MIFYEWTWKFKLLFIPKRLLTIYVNDYVSKGFKLAKFFKPQQTDADTFTKIKDEMTVDEAIESGRMHTPRPMVRITDIEMIADKFYKTE